MPEPITAELTGAVGITGVKVRLVYHPTNPYGILARVWDWFTERFVEWEFGRDLLHDGITRPTEDGTATGEGDVVITQVTAATMKITRSGPTGRADLVLVTATVRRFVDQAYDLVPRGAESGYQQLAFAAPPPQSDPQEPQA